MWPILKTRWDNCLPLQNVVFCLHRYIGDGILLSSISSNVGNLVYVLSQMHAAGAGRDYLLTHGQHYTNVTSNNNLQNLPASVGVYSILCIPGLSLLYLTATSLPVGAGNKIFFKNYRMNTELEKFVKVFVKSLLKTLRFWKSICDWLGLRNAVFTKTEV